MYYGCQLYYIKLNLWVELTIHKNYLKYFNKGCISFILNNKLYLIGGQFKDNTGYAIPLFSDNLLIFDIN